ncbi:MAG: ABC transporter ATP-binding protein [Rhodoblastus sp.]|jgi:branched-chain amino acid transport system ATP-binding protein
MTLLAFEDVHSYYGKAHVLHGVSLSVKQGERVAIIGRNGVGKTTVVNSFLGIAQVRRGRIELNGAAARAIRHFTAAKAGIAVVPQGRRIVPGLTVRENLQLGAAVDRRGPWNIERIFELFPILRERAEQTGVLMSGGQQQMLAIGRALMSNPELMVLDEPSEGLAPVIVDELAELFVRLTREGVSILLIEQNFGLVHRATERYYVLAKGTVVDEGRMAGLTIDSLKKHVAV